MRVIKAAAVAAMLAAPASAVEIGIYAGSGTSGTAHLAAYQAWLGRPAMYVTVNFNQTTWAAMLSDAAYEASTYAPLRSTTVMVYGVPMIPADGVSTLALCASGSYDANYLSIADQLAGYAPKSIARIGWEFNGSWQPWHADADPTNYVACYRRIVGIFRSVAPGLTFDWAPNAGTQAIAPETVYPGDDVVDIIGLDMYEWPAAGATPGARWKANVTQPNGLQWQVDFATAHGKWMSLPEWGCCGGGSGDSPFFVRETFNWVIAHGYLYANYWDDMPAYNGILSDGTWPAAGAEFVKQLGGSSR